MTARLDWLTELKAIETECIVAKGSLADAARSLRTGKRSLLDRTDAVESDLVRTIERCELTYLIRMFAVFEAAIRSYWKTLRDSNPRMRDLLAGTASRTKCPSDRYIAADRVREVRNRIVHEGLFVLPDTLAVYRGALCRFLSELPRDW